MASMRRIEGVKASYVGADDPRVGIAQGDRCLIINDDGPVKHVRWLTGSRKDEYGTVRSPHLVIDKAANERYDEFAFEAGRGPTAMTLDVTALHRAGGDVALFQAMEAEGHLDNLRYAARQAVNDLRHVIASDEAWDPVRAALGSQSAEVVHSAIVAAIIAAAEEQPEDDDERVIFEGYDDGSEGSDDDFLD